MFRFFLIESKKKKKKKNSADRQIEEATREYQVSSRTKLCMQSGCACELLEDSGNSVLFASFDQNRCGVNSFAAKFVFC